MNPRLLIALTALFLCLPFIRHAACAEDREDARGQYKNIQQKIQSEQERLKSVSRIETSTMSELERTNRELVKIIVDLDSYRTRLRTTREEVAHLNREIVALEDKIGKRKEWMKRKVRAIQRYGRFGDIILVLEDSEDLTQLIRRLRYLRTLATAERRTIENYRRDLAVLKERHVQLDRLYGRLREDESKVARTEGELSQRKKEKETILLDVRSKKAAYERMLKDLQESSERLSRMIRESEKKYKKYEGKGFRNGKGRMPWPASGAIAIPFGTTKDPRYGTPSYRNGVYIAAKDSAVTRAVHKGKTVFADWFKGYGLLVILDHGEGYHTLYANLSEIFLKTGDIIEEGDGVGKVGESGMLNRPALYFEIRYKGKPLDPAQWLDNEAR